LVIEDGGAGRGGVAARPSIHDPHFPHAAVDRGEARGELRHHAVARRPGGNHRARVARRQLGARHARLVEHAGGLPGDHQPIGADRLREVRRQRVGVHVQQAAVLRDADACDDG
jgi:hypothetical protein